MDLQGKAENEMVRLLISVYSGTAFCQKCTWWLYKKSENKTYEVKAWDASRFNILYV